MKVILTASGPDKVGLVKAIATIAHKGLRESKDLAEKTPVCICSGLTEADANLAKGKLEAAGGTVELQSEPGTESGKAPHGSVTGQGKQFAGSVGIAPQQKNGCRVNASEFEATPYGDADELKVSGKVEIVNSTDVDWEYIEVEAALLSSSGQIIEGGKHTEEDTVKAGGSTVLEVYFHCSSKKLLGETPEKSHVHVQVIACRGERIDLGSVPLPSAPNEMVALKSANANEILQLLSCSLATSKPDEENCVTVWVRALVQNLTKLHLPWVEIDSNIIGQSGSQLGGPSPFGEVPPGSVKMFENWDRQPKKLLKGAQLESTLLVCWPVATGTARCDRMLMRSASHP